jgi:hypothetical protein
MPEMPRPVPDVEDMYLRIGSDAIVLACASHPEFHKSFTYGKDRTVPALWLAGVLANHKSVRALAAHEPDDEPAGQAAVVVSGLDPFAPKSLLDAAGLCATTKVTRTDKWELPYRLAVALVLLNVEHLAGMGPGPGYTPARAMLLLYNGMTHRPADLDAWMLAIRDAICRPDQQLLRLGREQRGHWRATAVPRSES